MNAILILAALAITFLSAQAQCVFNSTHCDCAISTTPPGFCTRYSSGIPSSATCYVDDCKPNKYACDCSGTELCEVRTCDTWKADNQADVMAVGDLVACSFHPSSSMCITGPSSASPSMSAAASPSATASPSPMASASMSPSASASMSPSASASMSPSASASSSMSASPSASYSATPSTTPSISPTPSSSPVPEYRMFQFGQASDETMFNMTFFTDSNDYITSTYDMRNAWPHKTRYEHRWHTVMMYKNAANDDYFLCYVINTYDAGDDGLGIMLADVLITGSNGQTMRWVACDDTNDSCQVPSGAHLSSFFGNAAYATDGFCVKPLDYSGNSFTIQVANVLGAKGIRFIRPAQTVKEFLWADGPGNGMIGAVGTNGLVSGGSSPVITVNLKGLLVP